MPRIFLFFMLLTCFCRFAHADDLSMATTAFLDQGALPVMYTCDGKNTSPALSWTNPPAKTKSFAVIMSDPDASGGTFYHWIIYNLPASTAELAEGLDKLPGGAKAGKNNFGKMEYNGPCPPKGSVHTYLITLYALDGMLSLPAGADGGAVLAAMKKHTLKSVVLTAVYSRWKG